MELKTASKFCLFAIVCLCITHTTECKRLQNLDCRARPAVVPTDSYFYPYFVSLHRCNGSYGTNSPAHFKCVPSDQKNVFIPVSLGGIKKIVVLTNHTKCTTECVIKKKDCPYPNTYDENSCTCRCNQNTPPNDMKCSKIQSWNAATCGCICNKINRTCSNRRYHFDTKTCSCKCKPSRKRHCEEIGGIFVEKSCKCKKNQLKSIQISDNNSDTGKFVGSTTFWIYILIGEFVVLLVCFDSVLYCKKLGIMYGLTKRCRKQKLLEITASKDKQLEKRDIKVHLNEGCSSFSSQASLPTCYGNSHESSQS